MPNPDPRIPADPADRITTDSRPPDPPKNFSVKRVPDGQHFFIKIEDWDLASTRARNKSYRVYFAPINLIPSPILINGLISGANGELWSQRAFAGASLVCSSDAPSKGTELGLYDTQFYGKQGWFFCVGVNLTGQESLPTPPVASPSNPAQYGGDGIDQGDSSSNEIPPDVANPRIILTKVMVTNAGPALQMDVFADLPSPLGSCVGYQLYIENYRNSGQFFEWSTVNRGDSIGGTIGGTFVIQPDVPDGYAIGNVSISTGAPAAVTCVNGAMFDFGWSNERRIAVYASDRRLYDCAIAAGSVNQLGLTVTPAQTWSTTPLADYMVYPDTLDANTVRPHMVRVYFVSISATGKRRLDWQNSPFFELPFGMTAGWADPLYPINLTATTTGATVTLTWQSTILGRMDSTISHFNVYRSNAGKYSTTGVVNRNPIRPNSPYAAVKSDATLKVGGQYSFVDRAFDIDPSSATYDFDPTNPGRYRYWVTSVNFDGRENNFAFAGKGTVTGGTTLTRIFGDYIGVNAEGDTILLNPVGSAISRTVTAYVSLGVVTLSAAVANGDYEYRVGAVADVILLGNTQFDDSGPYTDSLLNRLFNTQFDLWYDDSVALPGRTPLSEQVNGTPGYGPMNATTDTQFTYKYYFSDGSLDDAGLGGGTSDFIHAGTRYPALTQGKQLTTALPAGLNLGPNRTDDPWSVWEYEASTADLPFWEDQNLPEWTGAVGLYLAAGATTSDFCTVAQLVRFDRFENGLQFSLAFDYATDSTTALESGVIKLQVVRYDRTPRYNSNGPISYDRGIERDISQADFSCTIIDPMQDGLPDWGREMRMTGRLRTGPYFESVFGVGPFAGATNGSNLVTTTEARLNWIGCEATLDDGAGTVVTGRIATVISGTSFRLTDLTDHTDGTVKNWTGATGNVLLTVTVEFTDYEIKIGLEGPAKSSGVAKTVYIRKIMMNGGRLGTAWTQTMLPDIAVGGRKQGKYASIARDRGGSGCTPAGTLVDMADGEGKPIETVREGDIVLGIGPHGITPCRVEQRQEHRCGLFVSFTTDHGQVLRCTDTHRVGVWRKTRRVWKDAKDLKIGDIVYVNVIGTVCREKIVSISSHKEDPISVYTLTVDKTHNYFVGGILCHNKPKENFG